MNFNFEQDIQQSEKINFIKIYALLVRMARLVNLYDILQRLRWSVLRILRYFATLYDNFDSVTRQKMCSLLSCVKSFICRANVYIVKDTIC